jgi:cell division protein FtsI (penicillin-binding protein 3)
MIKKSRLRMQKQKKGRRVVLYMLLFVVLCAIGYPLEKYLGASAYVKEALHNIKSTFSQNAPVRGTFYDRNLKQLAVTLERVSVYVRNREIGSIEETAAHLSKVLSLDKDKLTDQLESGLLRLWIAKDISQEQEVAIKDLQLPGVYLQRDEKRFYPNELQAAHFIGYVENGIGLSGVELYYDRLLASRKLKQQEDNQTLSAALDLILTIDLKIQDILENLARDIAVNEQAAKVTVYLLESGTGEIIGGANLPGFNPNSFAKYSQEQTGNMALVPLCMPARFRLFLRDATMLHTHDVNGVSPSAWSLASDNNNLGSQLRLWEWLGLEDAVETDFHVLTQSVKTAASQQKPVTASTTYYGFVPESATPLSLLATYSILLNKGKMIHPFVVKKLLDKDSGVEVQLSGKGNTGLQANSWSAAGGKIIESLFRSQARLGASGTYFFRDDILVSVDGGDRQQFFINDLLFVNIPAGSNDLNMLVVVQRPPQGVSRGDNKKKKTLEQIVEEKVERISVLQQIARSVADVFEIEVGDEDNYQGKKELTSEISSGAKTLRVKKTIPGLMPDLRGLSLRKSLRLLQGISLNINIQGTGRVLDQKPRPGSSLKGLTECVLILEKQEDIAPKKFSKGLSGKD